MCGAAPVWFGPPLSFNPWSSGVASNVAIRGLYLVTTALQQQDVQQIMNGSGWRRGAAQSLVTGDVLAVVSRQLWSVRVPISHLLPGQQHRASW